MDFSFDTHSEVGFISVHVSVIEKSVMFPGLSVLSLSLSPALCVSDSRSTSHPFMSQCQDVYSCATLLAALIILAQAAAGGIGCLSG